jgi:mono/diheme cytochrome c family protein
MKKYSAVLAASMVVLTALAWGADNVPDGVKTLAQQRCAGCHKGMFAPKGLKLDPAHIAAILDKPSQEVPTLKIVDTTSPEASYILKKVRRESGIKGKPMPPGKALTAEELQVIETWIAGLKQSSVPDGDLRIGYLDFRLGFIFRTF